MRDGDDGDADNDDDGGDDDDDDDGKLMCLPPSLESPGSPQRQSSPCLKPPGPRPPGTDHHDYHDYDDFDNVMKDGLMILSSPSGMPLRCSPVQSMQVNKINTMVIATLSQ